MVMKQCLYCKNTNAQCRQSFVMYNMALFNITELVNDGNRDSRFFNDRNKQRRYDYEIKCSHFEPKEGYNG